MDDVTPSTALIPAQPVATVTSTEAPFPPADSLPVFVPPSVTDPVSNLDFLPVDDAFALELRAESIEQLVGGDALRRGESERIEAGRSQTNADLVAGHDRVRVQGPLREHTGHGLAEQAAHLHTTVEGRLDVHAASEDTVLLAGHMRELWDGGAAIVAAMTDDTVAGGGIRVTTPLDLWVHGLMGVEERIGTCIADAVLMELGATHYEREYGPGVHAAGLAVYAGSLYQSSRSTFRPLMRVSSGVRNLIPGGGGGGAGNAPAASLAPASAAGDAGDAGKEAAYKTLCAATRAGGTMHAGVMAGVRSQGLTGIHRVDEVAALASGAHVARACVDPTGLRRGEDTAGQLAALRDAMRGEKTGAEGEVTSISRVPELGDTASVHEASALDIEGDFRSGATVPGMDAPVSHSAVSPPQPPPGVPIGLLGGADRVPEPKVSTCQFLAVFYRLCKLRNRFAGLRRLAMLEAVEGVLERIFRRLFYQFDLFGGTAEILARTEDPTSMGRVYFALVDLGFAARRDNKIELATEIHKAVDAITAGAIGEYQWLSRTYNLGEFTPTLAFQRPPMQRPPVTVAAPSVALAGRLDIPGPAHRIAPEVTLAFPQPAGGFVHATDVPGPPPASGLPGPSLAKAGDLGRARLDQPATAVGQPTTTEANVTPALAGPSSFWLQPANPLPAGTVPFDSGLHHADETAQPGAPKRARLDQPATAAGQPTTTEANVTPALAGPSSFWLQPADPWPAPGIGPVDSGLHHAGEIAQPGAPKRARLDQPATAAGQPTTTEANVTPALAGSSSFWLQPANPLPAGTVPFDSGLHHAGETAQPGAPKRARLDQPVTAAGQPTTTEANVTPALAGPSSFWLQPVDPWPAPGTVPFAPGLHHAGETVQPPPVAATASSTAPAPVPAGRTGAHAMAPPSAADPRRIRPTGMSGGPRLVAFDPWSAPPGPSRQVASAETIRPWVISFGARPGWQGAEAPGFGRVAPVAVDLPFSRREEIAIQLGDEDRFGDAVHALETGGADALGGSGARVSDVIADLYRLNAFFYWHTRSDAAMLDVDWSTIDALMRILDAPPRSP